MSPRDYNNSILEYALAQAATVSDPPSRSNAIILDGTRAQLYNGIDTT